MTAIRLKLILTFLASFALVQSVFAADSASFAPFNTGTITGNGATFTRSLDVTSVPASEFVLVSVTADYAPGPVPKDAYSNTMKMELSNGASTVYWPFTVANYGVIPGPGATVLRWTGVLPRSYIGGSPLTVKFQDAFTDAGGPYTSSLNNVAITLYPTATPKHTFTGFNTGSITSATAGFTRSLDTSGVPAGEYLIFGVTGDYVAGTAPKDAYSSTMQMELNNGSGTILFSATPATVGALPNSSSTSLRWTGVLPRSYTSGGPLSIRFVDPFTDTSGPYNSSINNVAVTLYPAPTPKKTFASVNSGTITSNTGGVTRALDVSGMTASEYVLVKVTADFAGASNPAYSQTLRLELNNGGSVVYWPLSAPTAGALANANATSLVWTGVLTKSYIGGTPLTAKFFDSFHDASGPYSSTLSNVVVTLYPVAATSTTLTSLNRVNPTPSKAATVNWTAVFPTAVTGLTASNFSLSPTVTGASIGTPTTADSGVTWNIPVTTGTGEGTLQLNLANATGLSRSLSTTLPFSGQSYTIDKTAPAITSAATASGTYNASFSYSILADTAVSYTAGSLPGGLTFSGNTISGTPSQSGSFSIPITATDAAGNTASGTLSLTLAKATATVTLGSLAQTYNGSPRTAAATTNPAGLNVDLTYNGSSTAPVNAGSYTVTGTINNANYQGTASDTLVVAKASATVTLAGLNTTYNRTARPASATTSPAGLNVGFTYNGGSTIPVNAGSYTVAGTINDTNYQGTASGTLVIAKASLTVTADDQSRAFGTSNPTLTATFSGFAAGDSGSVVSGSPALATTADASSPPGDYPITVTTGTLTAGNYTFTFESGTLTVTRFTYEDWKTLHFTGPEQENPSVSGESADADADNVTNLLEFAFGTDPRSNTSGPAALAYNGTLAGNGTLGQRGQPITRFEPSGNGVDFRVIFLRRNPATTGGITYNPQFSANLSTWQTSQAAPVILATDGEMQVVSVPYPLFINGKKARFFRMQVVTPL